MMSFKRFLGKNEGFPPAHPSKQQSNFKTSLSSPSENTIALSSPQSEASPVSPASRQEHGNDTSLNKPDALADSESDIVIAVMGPTGAGKSTFINKVAGIETTVVGHELESCTQDVQVVRCTDEQGRRVVLVDTPGFDDTNLSDLDILQRIAEWLKKTYEEKITLSGLLFFHRISDNRMAGSPLKLLETFKNICGSDALVNVILVTTMWDEVTEDVGELRETELCTKYWKTMIASGSRTNRFLGTSESGWEIISRIDLQSRRPVLLQRELVDLKKALRDTAAGRSLYRWLLDILEALSKAVEKVRRSKGRRRKDVPGEEKSYREREAKLRRLIRNYSSPELPRSSSPDSDRTLFSRSTSPSLSLRTNFDPTSSECFPPPNSPAVELHRTTNAQILEGTVTILKLIEKLVGISPIPGVQNVIGAVITIMETMERMKSVDESLMILSQNACSMIASLIDITDAGMPLDLQVAIDPLLKDLRDVQKVVQRLSEQSPTRKYLLVGSDRQAIEECNRKLVLGYGRAGLQVGCIGVAQNIRLEEKLDRILERLDYQMRDLQTLKEAHEDVSEYRTRHRFGRLAVRSSTT